VGVKEQGRGRGRLKVCVDGMGVEQVGVDTLKKKG
jgi:hypothetical protein